MRILVFLLALLATAKVVASEYSQRNALRDAVIAGHRDRAAQACHRDGKSLAVQIPPASWSRAREIELSFGNSKIEATSWDIDSPAWLARYRNPNLVIGIGERGARLECSYDTITGLAVVGRG